MPRPKKWRRVAFQPTATYFKPAGIPVRDLEVVALSVEEAEALRLKEVQGFDQEECARAMSVSRPTFHRVLTSARRKVAEAVVGGKALRIGGGDFLPATLPFRCARDGHQWNVPFQQMVTEMTFTCPKCSSTNVGPVLPPAHRHMHGWNRRHGQGGGGSGRRSA